MEQEEYLSLIHIYVTGSDKRHPFCIPAEKEGASTLALYESPIDAMSDASLRIRRGEAWRESLTKPKRGERTPSKGG